MVNNRISQYYDGDDLLMIIEQINEHTYGWAWTGRYAMAMCREITKHAANPELSLTWADAARLNQRVRESVGVRGIR